MPDTCVVHLVRRHHGIQSFQGFLDSYLSHRAGIQHDLLLLFKGFAREEEKRDYQQLLKGIPHQTAEVPDVGYATVPYFIAMRATDYPYYCFLNSYSTILADEWLGMLDEHIRRPGVGLVGASGSHESLYCSLLKQVQQPWPRDPRNIWRRIRQRFFLLPKWKEYFGLWPNIHLRSNAFMMTRSLMLNIECGPIRSKLDDLCFESGPRGLTKQVLATSLQCLVVGRDSKGYQPEDWWMSNTFRQRNQENLLVADNRTNEYLRSSAKDREALSRNAWGDKAQP
jgi:hypothetical protein